MIRMHAPILLMSLVVGGFAGLAHAANGQVNYTARADVFLAPSNGRTTTDIADGATYSQEQAINFAGVATRDIVLREVIEELDLKTTSSKLRGQIVTSVPLGTSIITISVTDSSSTRAAAIANSVASSLAEAVDGLTPVASAGAAPVKVMSIEDATPPSAPSSPRPALSVGVGLLGGLCLGIFLLFVRDALRTQSAHRSPDVSRR